METDLQIIVKGMGDEPGQCIANMLAAILRAVVAAEVPLDLRRMHRLVAASDFKGELAELSTLTASGNPITHTQEDYAIAVAQVLLLPRGSEIEILPVFNANALIPLTQDPKSEPFAWILHLVHHEFCHVHDDNKKLDAMPEVWLRHCYTGKDMFIRPLAEACWSEYAANRLSANSAPKAAIAAMGDSFSEALKRTKTQIDSEIRSYRLHRDLDKIMGIFKRHGEFLPKSASYVLGYMDGVEEPLDKLNMDEALNGSYFKASWEAMHSALQNMWEIYPGGWKNLAVYDGLARAMEDFYAAMGLILSTSEDGGAYVHIPLTLDTLPPVMI